MTKRTIQTFHSISKEKLIWDYNPPAVTCTENFRHIIYFLSFGGLVRNGVLLHTALRWPQVMVSVLRSSGSVQDSGLRRIGKNMPKCQHIEVPFSFPQAGITYNI